MPKLRKKGALSLEQAPGLVITLVTVVIVLAVGLLIVSNISDSLVPGSSAQNATNTASESLTNFASLMPVLGTVFIAAIVIGAVFFFRGKKT